MFRSTEQTYDNNIYMKWIFNLYSVLMMNLGFSILCALFAIATLFLSVTEQTLGIFLLLLLPFWPAMISIFATIDQYKKNRDLSPFKFFFMNGLRNFGLKGLKYGGIVLLTLTITISDIFFFSSLPIVNITIPFFVLLSALIIAFSMNMMYFRVRNPESKEIDIIRVSVYYLLRKWYVSLLNVLLFSAMLGLMFVMPQFGFLLTPAIFIGIIFLNCSNLHKS